jgi:Nuclease-related domain
MRSSAGTSAADEYARDRRRRRARAARGAGWALVGAIFAAGGTRTEGLTRVILWALAGLGLLVAWWYWRTRPDPERWQRGAAGERATAVLLDRLPSRTWAILHDRQLPGSQANLDHLVVGPSGVWVLDSKTTRSTVRARWRTVRFGDRRLDTGPVKWEAQVVADRLGVPVRPLVVVHGRGLRRRGGRSAGVRVVPANQVVRYVRRRWFPRRLDGAAVEWLTGEAEDVFPPAGRQDVEKGATLRG